MRYCPECRAEYAPGTEQCHDCDVGLVDLLVDDPHNPDRPAEPLVTIGAYDTPVTANILASRLEAEGIECFMVDEQAVAIHAGLTGAIGGVKVQVRESDAARAANVARQLTPPARVCPKCGSNRVTRHGLSFLLATLAVLTLGVLALFFPPRWECDACHNRWH